MKTTKTLLVVSLLALAPACTVDTKPSEGDKRTPDSSQADKRAEEAKKDAQGKLEEAKKGLEQAGKKVDEAADKVVEGAKEIDLGTDWSGPNRETWAQSWKGFADGTVKSVESGDWVIERGEAGVFTAYSKSPAKKDPNLAPVSDAALVALVKSKLVLDQDITARNIDVDVKGATATLNGTVDSVEAGEAIRITLGTRGIDRVVSKLSWATRRM